MAYKWREFTAYTEVEEHYLRKMEEFDGLCSVVSKYRHTASGLKMLGFVECIEGVVVSSPAMADEWQHRYARQYYGAEQMFLMHQEENLKAAAARREQAEKQDEFNHSMVEFFQAPMERLRSNTTFGDQITMF